MRFPRALLEDWLRDFYFDTEIDLGCSGVENYSFGELRRLAGIEIDELDGITLKDSQSLGCPELRQAIAKRWCGGETHQVMVTHGSSEALCLLAFALLRPGDEVVVLSPCYQPLRSVAEALGCRVVEWNLDHARRFQPDLETASRLIHSRTRMVIVNFPHNPTGASLTAGEFDSLVDLVAASGAYLLWDEAFAELTYQGPPLPDPRTRYSRAIRTGTLSKAYGLPGLRVGWVIADPAILELCIPVRDYATLYLSPLVERIAQRAVENGDALLQNRLAQARRNLAILEQWAGEHRALVGWVPPLGGVSVFLRLGIEDVADFCAKLATERGVLLVPGNCFGRRDFVRLGFGSSTQSLTTGLGRLSRALHNVSSRTRTAAPAEL